MWSGTYAHLAFLGTPPLITTRGFQEVNVDLEDDVSLVLGGQ
jgi:hypothetical protein